MRLPLASPEQWARRAACIWELLPGLSADERRSLKASALASTSASRDYAAGGYATRRLLLRGKAVAIQARAADYATFAALLEHCGGRHARRGGRCDYVIVGPAGGTAAARAARGPGACAVMGNWLSASLVVGRQLPAHRPGCPAARSPFSLPKSCISPSEHSGDGYEICCYAPRLLEGLLLSTSRVHDRDAVVATVRALGGECTDELTRRHTHLIAGAAEGLKFEYAQTHRIPVVSRAWLEQTIRLGAPMQERCFPVNGGRGSD
eukprot:gnl/TRDRNA2_/TRDRNA2_125557_c1_seq1.p1 gnl/TRDRNA2_/TRDRNA2_125557_c1~~gnl/TRDRNA2_/TRDRNA2_125557_c1_seq1.p1  ORF type:complete len:279 (-),score=32.67 gnl/TRDRNA2_/TRDRNA2_125557_c1_seq1:39-830(-)